MSFGQRSSRSAHVHQLAEDLDLELLQNWGSASGQQGAAQLSSALLDPIVEEQLPDFLLRSQCFTMFSNEKSRTLS